ncbi:hypothetical protein HanPSC8_Chr03g0085971 [Helianthus annuus]|nr:hypothetical protein HanPSC8_Chr03g0085971 [Helianthus annuus]
MFLSTPCRSNQARVGKKSDKFGCPKILVMFEAMVCNSTPRLKPFSSIYDTLSHIILVMTLASVKKAISRMSTWVPILLKTFMIDFLTSSLRKELHALRFLLLKTSWTKILRRLRQVALFLENIKSCPS